VVFLFARERARGIRAEGSVKQAQMRDSICELLFLEHCKFFETTRGGQKIKERRAFHAFFLEVIQEIVYKKRV
jgi:hypothetical protein